MRPSNIQILAVAALVLNHAAAVPLGFPSNGEGPVRSTIAEGRLIETAPGLHLFRLGHAAGIKDSLTPQDVPIQRKQPNQCTHMMKMKAEAEWQRLQNALRGALGLPLIQEMTPPHPMMSMRPNSPPIGMVSVVPRPLRVYHFKHDDESFLDRLQRSVDNLGTWESRAVSFVMGCGLGVLLRMLFVFGVLFVRAFKRRDDEISTAPIDHSNDETVGLLAPPAYTDEKIALEKETPTVEFVKEIITVEPANPGVESELLVFWVDNNGAHRMTPAPQFSQTFPQQLIHFYESNLQWAELQAQT